MEQSSRIQTQIIRHLFHQCFHLKVVYSYVFSSLFTNYICFNKKRLIMNFEDLKVVYSRAGVRILNWKGQVRAMQNIYSILNFKLFLKYDYSLRLLKIK